jgi:hypothetical protein
MSNNERSVTPKAGPVRARGGSSLRVRRASSAGVSDLVLRSGAAMNEK